MKYIILILTISFSGQSMATDLIFKSGFEASGLVSGSATGINNTGLSLQLTTHDQTELLNIDVNGHFVFATDVVNGNNWSVSIINLPNTPQQQNCQATNTEGVMIPGGFSAVQITCNDNPWNWNQMNWDESGWN